MSHQILDLDAYLWVVHVCRDSFDQLDGLLPGSISFPMLQQGELHQPSVQCTYSSRQTVAFCPPWCLRSRRGLQSLWPEGKEKHFRAFVTPLCRSGSDSSCSHCCVQLFAVQINLLILFLSKNLSQSFSFLYRSVNKTFKKHSPLVKSSFYSTLYNRWLLCLFSQKTYKQLHGALHNALKAGFSGTHIIILLLSSLFWTLI